MENSKKMKRGRIKIKKNEEDNGMNIIQKKLKRAERIAHLTNKNHTYNISCLESNSSITSSIHKEKNLSQYIPTQNVKEINEINQELYIIPSASIDIIENSSDIYSKTFSNDFNELENFKKQRYLIQKSNTINDSGLKQKNSSVESAHNRVYVHKKLKDFKTFNINIHRNIKSCRHKKDSEINFGNTSFYQSNKSKDLYSKLVVFSNKPKYFKKKQLTEIENISNGMSDKIKDIRYFESPIKKKKGSYFKITSNENENENNDDKEKNDNKNDNKNDENNIENKEVNEIDNGYDYRLDNLKDYINIYSINDSNDKTDEKDSDVYEDNNNTSTEEEEEEDEINIHKEDKDLFINVNKSSKSRADKIKDKRNITNVNKNAVTNNKILIPEDNNINKKYTKTSYGFFNTYKNTIITPYPNYVNKNKNKNNETKNALKNDDNLPHSKTKTTINNFVYHKKCLVSPNPKNSSNLAEGKTRNKNNNVNTRKISTLITEKPKEINRMNTTENNFYAKKKNSVYNLKEYISNKNSNNIQTEKTKTKNNSLSKRKIPKNIYNKLNTLNQTPDNKNNTLNKNDEKNKDKKENKENKDNKEVKMINNKITDLSVLEKVKFLELQLKLIITKITKYQNCEKECSDFILFYLEHNYFQEKIDSIKNYKNKNDIKNHTKMEIIFLFICYDILCSRKFNKACIILKSIFSLLYDNFIVLLVLILKNHRNEDRIFLRNFNKIIDEYEKNKKTDIKNIDENKVVEIIGNNTNEIINYYKMLIDSLYKKYYNENDYSVKFPECIKNIELEKTKLNKIKNVMSTFFYETYKKAGNYEFIEYKYFFYLFLSHKTDKTPNVKRKASRKLRANKSKDKNATKSNILPQIKDNYKFSLILDLDETLIYLQNKDSLKADINSIILRPNLNEFLHEMKSIYELIIFSENSQEYVEPIIDLIQKKENYFDYIICKSYITYDSRGNEIKDLSLLGRDLKNVIVVDNIKQYYKNKENLICIKSFFGDVNNDKKTLKLLGNVLKEIKIDAENTGDIRTSINQLKYKLYPKVINSLDS